MAKVILEFDQHEDREELKYALDGAKAFAALFDVGQQVFRPARKHGYSDPTITELLEKLNKLVEKYADESWPKDEYGVLDATDLIGLLEKRYYEVLDGNGVSPD